MDRDMDDMELNELREQLSLLKDKLRHQEIVNENSVLKAVKMGVSSINRRGIGMALLGLFAIPFCCGVFAGMGFSAEFLLGTSIFLLVNLLATISAHLGLIFVNVRRDNLVTVGLRAARSRKIYKNWYWFTVPMIVVWLYFYYKELAAVVDDPRFLMILIISSSVGGVIGGAIGLWIHFRTLHEMDDVLENIKDLQMND